MGGKTATSTSQVQVPPAVLAQYQSVNAQANQTAQTPFQKYSGQFVAPVNTEQSAGITATNTAANEAQPYYANAAGQLGSAQLATAPVNGAAEAGTVSSSAPLTGAQIDRYLSPYLGTVLNSTEAIQNQENQQQQAGQLGNAITSGAFGSDRTGIAAANLEEQQNLANANVISGIANQGYESALGTAQQQQQIGLAGAKQLADIGQMAYGEGANTASEFGALGSGAQSSALQGAQAQIGAGTVQQQTQQAQDTARYNQFLQQQSYPFQVDQFLADIAEGTGSLSGSTTVTTQPQGILSDRDLKYDIKKVGKTFDGQNIYSYKIEGDPRTRIGLMAQEVEKRHPHAVGLAGGFKTVDYSKATREAANDGHFYRGGVVPFRRVHRYLGGGLAGVLEAQQQMYGMLPGVGMGRQIPIAGSGGYSLAVAQPSGAVPDNVEQAIAVGKLAKMGYDAYKWYNARPKAPSESTGPEAPSSSDSTPPADKSDSSSENSSGDSGDGSRDQTDQGEGGLAGGSQRGGRIGKFGGGQSGDALMNTTPTPTPSAPTETYSPGAPADPYGTATNAQQRNIPTTSGAHTLAAAPAGNPVNATKQDLSDFVSVVGQFLARGGVAGRSGFDDGGTPDAQKDDASQPPSSQVQESPSSGGVAGWWGRNKGILLPILAGIGAAGTEPTVHPGIALAAGLEEAARDYVPTQEGLARAQGLEAQAQTAQIGRQMAALKLGVARQALAPTPGGVAPQAAPAVPAPMPTTNPAPATVVAGMPGAPPTGSPGAAQASSATGATQPSPGAVQTAQGLAARYRAQFFVNTARTPEEQAEKDAAIKKDWALGGTMFEQQADNDYQARVQRDQQNNRNAAQQMADAQYAIATSPQASQEAREAALARYNALRQWTGDGTQLVGGIVRNSRTNQPEIGPIASQGLTPQEKSAAFAAAVSPVVVGNELPQPLYKAEGFSSPEDYVAARVSAAQTGAEPQSSNVSPAPVAASAGKPATISAPLRSPPAPTGSAPGEPQGAPPVTDPHLAHALSDPQYQIPALPKVVDQTTQKAAFQQQQLNIENRNELLKGAGTLANASATALQYLQAAQLALSGKPVTGLYANLWNTAVRAVHPGQGTLSSNDYVEASKWLVNAAAQQAQSTFPGATEKEMGIALDFANPSPHMDMPALVSMIQANERIARYGLLMADKATVAANHGINPQAFAEWGQKYWPRDKLVNASQIRENAQGQRVYLINGKWVQ